jgi:short-subunit dehydrogenase
MNLLLVAKVAGRLKQAADSLRKEFPGSDVQYLRSDLRDPEGPQRVYDWCRQKAYRVNILINNAGVAGTSEFDASEPAYHDERILVNIRALVLLTRLFLPDLKSFDRAYILNVGSLSAYYPIPYKSVYSASKAFVYRFTKALKQELAGSGVSISVVNPNGVRTNEGTNGRINSHSKFTRRYLILEASEIARLSVEGLLKGKTVILPGFYNRLMLRLTLMVPRGFRERNTAKIFRKELI